MSAFAVSRWRSLGFKLGLTLMLTAGGLSLAGGWLLDREGHRAVDDNALRHLSTLAMAMEGSFSVYDREQKRHATADLVAELVGQGALDAVQWEKLGYGAFGMLAEDGMHPDQVAELFGYRSGDAMVRADSRTRRPLSSQLLPSFGRMSVTPKPVAAAS